MRTNKMQEENKIVEELKDEEKQLDVKVGEADPVVKDVMTEIVGIAKEVVQARREQEGEETSGLEHSFPKIPKDAMAKAKAEDWLAQMITCLPNFSSKVEKKWDLHAAYHWVWIGCITFII